MTVCFQGTVPLERTLRYEAEQRLWSALEQFHQHIARISVSVSVDLGNRDGRPDKICRIRLETHSLGEIAICVGDPQLESAIFRAVARLARAVQRGLGASMHPVDSY